MHLQINIKIKEDIYKNHLAAIDGIHFNLRDIDLLACFAFDIGMHKTLDILGLSKRVIKDRIKLILTKTNFSSIEEILFFLKLHHKLHYLKLYFLNLLANYFFESMLDQLAATTLTKNIYVVANESSDNEFATTVLKYIKLASFTINDSNNYASLPTVKIFSDLSSKNNKLLLNNGNKQLEIVFKPNNNYYLDFVQFIDFITSNQEIKKITAEFKVALEKLNSNINPPELEIKNFIESPYFKNNISQNYNLVTSLIIFLTVVITIGVIVTLIYLQNKVFKETIRSEALLFDRKSLLYRQPTLELMHKKLEGTGVKILALIGPEGSGKTVITQQYISEHKPKLHFQLDATNENTIYQSFELLANYLCRTPEDIQTVARIKAITNVYDRSIKLKLFIRSILKKNSGWTLIFDNVKKFGSIEWYFPDNTKMWGSGKVIITSTDFNIINNHLIRSEHFIHVPELTEQEKLEIYNNIYPNNPHAESELISLLHTIPAYPLDITLTAHFIKRHSTNISEFQKYYNRQSENFLNLQEEILRNTGKYNKTRHIILKEAINYLNKTDNKFISLLFFSCLLSNNDIPIDLLANYTSDAKVIHFIALLKETGLISEKIIPNIPQIANRTFSFEGNVQNLMLKECKKLVPPTELKYILQTFLKYGQELNNYGTPIQIKSFIEHSKQLSKNLTTMPNKLLSECPYNLIESINYNIGASYLQIKDYINAEKYYLSALKYFDNNEQFTQQINIDLGKLYKLQGKYQKAEQLTLSALHIYQKLYGSNNLYTIHAYINLGSIYRKLGYYEKSLTTLQSVLSFYEKHLPPNDPAIGEVLYELGCLYDGMLDHQKARLHLEKAIKIFSANYGDKNIKVSECSIRLANVFRKLCNFKLAQSLLREHITNYQEYYGKDHIDSIWVQTYLGALYRDIGNFEESLKILQAGFEKYAKYYSKNHTRIGWMAMHLGRAYFYLNELILAQKYLEIALEIYKDSLVKNNIQATYLLVYLGDLHTSLNNFDQAKQYLQRALNIYSNYQDLECNIMAAITLNYLSRVHLIEKNYTLAELELKQALNIFEKAKHPTAYYALEKLAELAHQNYRAALLQKNFELAEQYKNQEIMNLKQALEIVKTYFPADSIYISNINNKIKKLDIHWINSRQ